MPVEGSVVAGELASQGGGACLCLCLCSQGDGARRGEENHERQELGRVVEQLERLCVGENNNQRSLSVSLQSKKESSNTDGCFVGGLKALFQSAIGNLRKTGVLS